LVKGEGELVEKRGEGKAPHEMEIVEKLGAPCGKVSLPHPTPIGRSKNALLSTGYGANFPRSGEGAASRDRCPD
jgi:hypothetical protein